MKLNKKTKSFVYIVFAITYPAWIAAAIISNFYQDSPLIFLLHILGGLSPLIATIVYLIKTKSFGNYLYRLTNLNETTLWSWLIVVSPILVMGIAQLIVYHSLNIDPRFQSLGIIYGVGLLFFGPIPEELGWRGVLFPEINNISFKKAQIYTSIIWLTWHLPLFFIIGTYQNGLGIFSFNFLFFAINIIVQSLILGYLFIIGRKNIVLPILFHYFVNLCGEMFIRNDALEIVIITAYITILVILIKTVNIKQKFAEL